MDHDARNFIAALGGYRSVASALSKRGTTVHIAMQAGVFPASWYDALCKLAKASGIDAPERSLFSFLQLAASGDADGGSFDEVNLGDRLHEHAS